MADPQEVLAARVRLALAAAFGAEYADADPVIRPSTFADYQANVALPLAKQLGRPPREVAAEIAAHLDVADVCDTAEVSGPGFINFSLRRDWIAAEATALLGDPRLGVPLADPPDTVVVDYSGPNVAKELHAGHLRATVQGDAIARILEQLAAGDFTAFYQAARAEFDANPQFADRARRRVPLLQSGDPESRRLWQVLVAGSMDYLMAIYRRLDIKLTEATMAPESFYNSMLADVCAELERDGIAVISEGALCAFPPGFTGRDGAPIPLILRKRDGGYGYDTTDVAAIRYRLVELHARRIIYVVGSEQSLHLQMVFAVARLAGWLTGGASAEHATIGLMTGPGGKRLKTRTGEQVKLSELIDEAVERAGRVIADRYDDPAEREQIAEAVGVGALKYADLSVARESSYVLDFDRMLALTGDTGPYLQYATARIRSIFRKAGLDPDQVSHALQLPEDPERALALVALKFGSAVAQAGQAAEPHVLAGYLFDVASTFTTFYEHCPVLGAPTPELRDSRLALCALTLRILTAGLGMLGIPVPERM